MDDFRPSFPEIVDNSMRVQFVTCPQKFFNSTIKHYQPARKSVHLHAGGAFAKGTEVTRKAFFDEGLSYDAAIERGYNAVLKAYGEDYVPDQDTVKTIGRMADALIYYFEQFPLHTDFIQPHRIDGVAAIEFNFTLPIDVTHPDTGQPLLYYGRFDMLGVKHPEKMLWVVDEKTASRLGESWVQQWNMASQITGYVWGAQQYGMPVVGAIMRGISILTNGYGHAQSIQQRNKHTIAQWYTQMCSDFRRAIQMYKDGYFDYNLSTSCNAYFRPCEYMNVCQSNDPQHWLDSSEFVQRIYNPMLIGKDGHDD